MATELPGGRPDPSAAVPLQNRVAPTGELVSVASRGLLMGNRGGQFHAAGRTLGRRRWASRAWIACVLDWQGRREQIWVDRHYTQLFFLDEATALAAGHRPCGYCRRADYRRFAAYWAEVQSLPAAPSAPQMDEQLHRERWASSRGNETFSLAAEAIPDGAIVLHHDAAHLVGGGRLWAWSFEGYRRGPDQGVATRFRVVTPPSIVAILAAGYQPLLHPTAIAAGSPLD